ncbi:MAG: hypothetical protein ACF788_10555 [Novipirellula sp. JB048]
MTNIGDALGIAMAETLARGMVFWVQNECFSNFYGGARSKEHPCLVCSRTSVFAPGTSSETAATWTEQKPFVLTKPESLDGERSTFMLAMRKKVPQAKINRYMGNIHADDLRALNQILGQERDV